MICDVFNSCGALQELIVTENLLPVIILRLFVSGELNWFGVQNLLFQMLM